MKRLARCVFGYVLTNATGWTAAEALAGGALWSSEPTLWRRPFWDLVLSCLAVGPLILVGLPSILIALLLGSVHTRSDRTEHRFLLLLLLVLPTWWFFFAGTPVVLWVQLVIQAVFAFAVMPVPLVPRLGGKAVESGSPSGG
ncbi:hypothetical protein [Streptomyces sp. NPDC049585]|uniref:hypothetical protein n=1 Tax=Streptomyces sp. NPDC049585 TaxID=3155154 RepID=UPI0034457CAE